MRDEKNERYPSYVPWYYRIFLKLRKLHRQTSIRQFEKKARIKLPEGVLPDEEAVWSKDNGDGEPNPLHAVNKSARWIDEDMALPQIKKIADEIESLKKKLDDKNLKYTNTAATFLSRMFYPRSEYTKMWENTWTIHHSNLKPNYKVMDVGGASTPFSFYLASLGCDVHIIDNDWGNCGTLYNAEYVAKKMNWKLKIHDRDVSKSFPFEDGSFDRIYSICTVEHLTSTTRQNMMKEVGRILKPGGIAAITMCYDPNHEVLTVDQGLRFGYRDKLYNDIILPSGLEIYKNSDLLDYKGDEGFLGAIFLQKR